MTKKIAMLSVTVLGVALLIYSASRSISFISNTLPDDRQILAWFGLAALDGGMIAWALVYIYNAYGWQRPIALIMAVADMGGAFVMFTMDTLYQMGKNDMIKALTQDELRTAALALSFVIAANIAATLAYHLLDPRKRLQAATVEVLENIDDEVIRHLGEHASELAGKIGPTVADDLIGRIREQYLTRFSTGGQAPLPLPAVWQKAFDTSAFGELISKQEGQEGSAAKPPFAEGT